MMKRRIVPLVLALMLFTVIVVPVSVSAASVTEQPTNRFFVNDFANVINQTDEDAIFNAGVQLYEKTRAQIVVVTVDTIDGNDSVMYATQLGRAWGVGEADKDTGIVLLLAMQERDVGIAVGYGLEGAVTDAQSYMILDEYAMPYFEQADYSKGLLSTYDALVNEVYLEFGLEADPNYVPIEQLERRNSQSSVLSVIALLVVICVISFSMRRFGVRVPFMFFPFVGFHHHGGHGGNSGGSFSGFRGGGGSFGGGGASRKF